MHRTLIIRREYLHFIPKYSRYEKRHSNLAAHISPAFRVEDGDQVTVGQCRPLSKTVSFLPMEHNFGKYFGEMFARGVDRMLTEMIHTGSIQCSSGTTAHWQSREEVPEILGSGLERATGPIEQSLIRL